MTLFIGKSINKDTLYFSGKYQGKVIENILICNRCFDEGTFAVELTDIEIQGKSIIANASSIKKIK